jgi:hypothetical protein
MREHVSMLTAFNVSEQAICNELVRRGVPCGSRVTLRRRFKAELAMGRDRMVAALGRKVLEIALSDRQNNLAAAQYLLGKLGGPLWREPKDEAPLLPVTDERVRFYMPSNGRDQLDAAEDEAGPTIEGKVDSDTDR